MQVCTEDRFCKRRNLCTCNGRNDRDSSRRCTRTGILLVQHHPHNLNGTLSSRSCTPCTCTSCNGSRSTPGRRMFGSHCTRRRLQPLMYKTPRMWWLEISLTARGQCLMLHTMNNLGTDVSSGARAHCQLCRGASSSSAKHRLAQRAKALKNVWPAPCTTRSDQLPGQTSTIQSKLSGSYHQPSWRASLFPG